MAAVLNSVLTQIVKTHWQKLLLLVLVLIILAPVFYYRAPWFVASPDIFYVKAKILSIAEGSIFADPITGYDSFHPPFYHLFLTPFVKAGFDLDFLLIMVSIINVILTYFLTFKVVSKAFDDKTAGLTCILLPAIHEFMGSGNILLATSFSFSVPFYLAGLWFYISSKKSPSRPIVASIFWGLAFLISPVYVFLIVMTFIHEWFSNKSFKRLVIMLVTFLAVIIPFIYQAITVYTQGLHDTDTFAFWRGFPDMVWMGEFLTEFISPAEHNIVGIPAIIHMLILLFAAVVVMRDRKIFWFIPPAAVAYFLTFYHYSGQYAIRIHLFMSIFIVAIVARALLKSSFKRTMWMLPALLITLYSVYFHYHKVYDAFNRYDKHKQVFFDAGKNLWENMETYLEKGQYIYCTKATYFQFILPFYPVHSLGAYRTMKYYQLSNNVVEMVEKDYNRAIGSSDYNTILDIAEKYEIKMALAATRDLKFPLFQVLSKRWTRVYMDKFFIIYKRDD